MPEPDDAELKRRLGRFVFWTQVGPRWVDRLLSAGIAGAIFVVALAYGSGFGPAFALALAVGAGNSLLIVVARRLDVAFWSRMADPPAPDNDRQPK